MQYNIQKRGENPLFTVVIVDSRSDKYPEWVKKAVKSVIDQTLEDLELILIDNRDRNYSIGKCYNEGLKLAEGKWVFYLGDDDYISPDYLSSLKTYIDKFIDKKDVIVSTYCIFFDDNLVEAKAQDKAVMGAYLKSYFIENLFDETLEKHIDIDAMNKAIEAGKEIKVCPYHYGYFYRQHSSQISGRKIINESEVKVYDVEGLQKDFYIIDKIGTFTNSLKEHFDAVRTKEFLPELAEKSQVIWAEWGDENAIKVSKWGGGQIKILRIHHYELYRPDYYNHIDFNAFDFIIVVSEYMKQELQKIIGEQNNIVVIPVGIDLNKFTFNENKDLRKIAYAGYLCRKKGTDLLLFIAKHFPEYEFHLKGEFQEPDFKEWFLSRKPDNIFLEPWDDKVNEFFQDKGYVISTSVAESAHLAVMEGMATGCKPLIYNWIGAAELYSHSWIYESIDTFKEQLIEWVDHKFYQQFVAEHYNLEMTFYKIEKLLTAKGYDCCTNVSEIADIAG